MAYKEPEGMDEEELGKANAEIAKRDDISRSEAAVSLKIAGATYAQIARTLDYPSVHTARCAVESALAATAGEDDREQLRYVAGRRIDRLLRSMWGKATDEKNPEHLAAARTALALIDRHIKLYGLDAPQEMVHYTPTGAEFETVLKQIYEKASGSLPEEADIVDVEIEDDGEDEERSA